MMNQVNNIYKLLHTLLHWIFVHAFIFNCLCLNVCMTEYFSRSSRCFEFEDDHATAMCPAIGVASTSSSRLGCFKTNVVRQQSTNMLAYFVQANTTDNQLSMLQQLAINLKFYCILNNLIAAPPEWCREGGDVTIDQATVMCAPTSIVSLRSKEEDITTITSIPPSCKCKIAFII